MKQQLRLINQERIEQQIFLIRGFRIMLDFDLALLYGVPTKRLNEQVKRNLKRFPDDFMFQLNSREFEEIKLQIESAERGSSSQTVMMKKLPANRTDKYLPYAFTEQGVAMLSGILSSEKAIKMNIAIMRAFVEIRKIVLTKADIKLQLTEIKKRIENHDGSIVQLYEAIENLLDENASKRKWDERQRIGFKK